MNVLLLECSPLTLQELQKITTKIYNNYYLIDDIKPEEYLLVIDTPIDIPIDFINKIKHFTTQECTILTVEIDDNKFNLEYLIRIDKKLCNSATKTNLLNLGVYFIKFKFIDELVLNRMKYVIDYLNVQTLRCN